MKRLSAIIAFFLMAAVMRAESLALVYYDKDCPQQFATLNGARDALKDLSLRYNKKLEVENFTPKADTVTPDLQAQALRKAKESGAKGAILFAAKGDTATLVKAVSDLSGEGFPVAVIGRDIDSNDVLCSVLLDGEKFLDAFRKAFPAKTNQENFNIFFVVKDGGEMKISKEKAASLMPSNIGKENIDAISGSFKTGFYSCSMFSLLQKKFGRDWYYMDNYGIVILDERVLADAARFEKDKYRLFVYSPQTSPIMSEYLRTGDIGLCVADDFFGYGYISSQKLFAKIFDNKVPYKKTEFLAPLKYTPEDFQKFTDDWINFQK